MKPLRKSLRGYNYQVSDLQFWGKKALEKIVSRVSSPVCTNNQTAIKGRISYPRVLVEVNTKQERVESISFRGPDGEMVNQAVKYKWKPLGCSKYGLWGHLAAECRTKPKGQMVWMLKKTVSEDKITAPLQHPDVDVRGCAQPWSVVKKRMTS
ncbi:hypothetical protein Droror1_Dr00027634 [Drosera rotundifolia]